MLADAAAIIASASAALSAIGLLHMVCFPLSSAAIVSSACQLVLVVMITTSISLRVTAPGNRRWIQLRPSP